MAESETTSEILTQRIVELAGKPKSVSSPDIGSFSQQDIDAVARAKRELEADEGINTPNRGLRFNKLRAPGAA